MKMIIHTRDGRASIAQTASDDISEQHLVDLLWRAAAGMDQWDMDCVAGEMIERADAHFDARGTADESEDER